MREGRPSRYRWYFRDWELFDKITGGVVWILFSLYSEYSWFAYSLRCCCSWWRYYHRDCCRMLVLPAGGGGGVENTNYCYLCWHSCKHTPWGGGFFKKIFMARFWHYPYKEAVRLILSTGVRWCIDWEFGHVFPSCCPVSRQQYIYEPKEYTSLWRSSLAGGGSCISGLDQMLSSLGTAYIKPPAKYTDFTRSLQLLLCQVPGE